MTLSPEQRARKTLFGDPTWDVGALDDWFTHPETGYRITIRQLAHDYAVEDASICEDCRNCDGSGYCPVCDDDGEECSWCKHGACPDCRGNGLKPFQCEETT